MGSLKKNFAYRGLLTLSNYILGFITFPYITRVLGPNNFGVINYALNTIDYFLLFATLGIATLGTREIAAARGDKRIINQTYSRLFGINLWFTLGCLALLFLSVWLVPQFAEIKSLLIIGSAKILFRVFAVEWFFTGLENFKYITIRALIIRILYILSVFILVRNSGDYQLYFLLTILSFVLNSCINFVYSLKFVEIEWNELLSLSYGLQNIKLGIYFIMSSMYITFNVMFLGMVSTNDQVGYYSTAVKLYFIILSLFSAYTSVMLPRMSSLAHDAESPAFKRHINRSYILVLLTSIPIIVYAEIFAPGIIKIVSGEGYEASVLPMRILMPVMGLVWIAQIIVFQGLIPLKHDKSLLVISIIGASFSILFNLTFTPKLGAVGSAWTLVLSEIVVTSCYILIVMRQHIIPLPTCRSILTTLIPLSITLLMSYCINYVIHNQITSALVGGGLTCGLILIMVKYAFRK